VLLKIEYPDAKPFGQEFWSSDGVIIFILKSHGVVFGPCEQFDSYIFKVDFLDSYFRKYILVFTFAISKP